MSVGIDCALTVDSHPDFSREQCGDAGLIQRAGKEIFVALLDVLGHGPHAACVARAALDYLERNFQDEPMALMQGLHAHIRGSRGAVVALCRLDPESAVLRYVGVGNIAARCYGAAPRTLLPREGIVGYVLPLLREETVALLPGDVFTLCTDGIPAHVNMAAAPGVLEGDAQTIAARIVGRFRKPDDDAACAVLRITRP